MHIRMGMRVNMCIRSRLRWLVRILQELEGISLERLGAVAQAGDLQVFTHQGQHLRVHLNECRAGGPTAQRLNPDAAGSGKEVQEASILDLDGEDIEKRLLDSLHNWASTACFWPFQLAPLRLTGHYSHTAPPG